MSSPSGLSWRRLHPGEARLAYPLIVATGGVPELADWVELASRWAADPRNPSGRGVVGLQGRDGVFVAIFLYEIGPWETDDLLLPMLRAAEIVKSDITLSAALGAASNVAREAGCSRVVMEVDDSSVPGRALATRLASLQSHLGLTREGSSWVMASFC